MATSAWYTVLAVRPVCFNFIKTAPHENKAQQLSALRVITIIIIIMLQNAPWYQKQVEWSQATIKQWKKKGTFGSSAELNVAHCIQTWASWSFPLTWTHVCATTGWESVQSIMLCWLNFLIIIHLGIIKLCPVFSTAFVKLPTYSTWPLLAHSQGKVSK